MKNKDLIQLLEMYDGERQILISDGEDYFEVEFVYPDSQGEGTEQEPKTLELIIKVEPY